MTLDQNQLLENWQAQLRESFEACILQDNAKKYQAFDYWIKPLVEDLLQAQQTKTREEERKKLLPLLNWINS